MAKSKSNKDKSDRGDSTLAEQAYHTLKSEILMGHIEEGVFLDVDALLKKYEIGRTPFREACHRLHLERLVELVPRRGLIVPELTLREVRDLLEARIHFEPEIAALAAARRSETQVEELSDLAQKTYDIEEGPEQHGELIAANKRFHEALGRLANNKEMNIIGASLLDRMVRVSRLQLANSGWNDVRELHDAIVVAIAEQDPDAARRAVLADILHGQHHVFPPDAYGGNGQTGSLVAAAR